MAEAPQKSPEQLGVSEREVSRLRAIAEAKERRLLDRLVEKIAEGIKPLPGTFGEKISYLHKFEQYFLSIYKGSGKYLKQIGAVTAAAGFQNGIAIMAEIEMIEGTGKRRSLHYSLSFEGFKSDSAGPKLQSITQESAEPIAEDFINAEFRDQIAVLRANQPPDIFSDDFSGEVKMLELAIDGFPAGQLTEFVDFLKRFESDLKAAKTNGEQLRLIEYFNKHGGEAMSTLPDQMVEYALKYPAYSDSLESISGQLSRKFEEIESRIQGMECKEE